LAANLELEGFMPDHLNFVGYFAQRAAHLRKIATSERVIHLPTRTERWHVTRGPFVHDKTKDVFERKTYKRLIQAFNADKAAIDDWISYVNANLPAGVNLCVERFEWIQLEGLGESLRSQVGKEVDDALRVEEMTLGPRSGTPTTESEIDVNSGGSLERREGRPLSFEEDVRMRAEAFIRRHSTSKPAK
ncbi:ribosomal protein S10p/S20e-domain-containing protein, partial [Zopfochytrium polystomum]